MAVPFVTGATALLWSEFPSATAAQIKLAITHASHTAAGLGGAAAARCRSGLPDSSNCECEVMNRMTNASESHDSRDPIERPPHRVRLPGFITDDEIGLGDVIKRATSYFGIQPCGGCERRAAALNRWMVFTRDIRCRSESQVSQAWQEKRHE